MKTLRPFLLLALCFVTNFPVRAQTKKITAPEAKNHIGESITVCGKVATTRYAEKSKGQPTFLNLDEPYPKQIFTIVIWGTDRSKFGQPENEYRNSGVCVTGKITSHRGTPEIVLNDPTEITIQK